LFSIRANFTVAVNVLGVVETTKPDKQKRTVIFFNVWPQWVACLCPDAGGHSLTASGRT